MKGLTLTFRERAETRAVVDAQVSATAPCFDGHFPGRPVLPAVVQLHDVVLRAAREAWPDLPALRRVTRLKFRRSVGVDSALTLRMERRDDTLTFTLDHGGETVSSGALAFAPESLP